jgi:hypothetical protein
MVTELLNLVGILPLLKLVTGWNFTNLGSDATEVALEGFVKFQPVTKL